MLYLKAINIEDIQKEYEFITNTPENENGFTNKFCGCSFDEFEKIILPKLINNSKGIDLQSGYVASTEYFLWNDDNIVGLFRIRHSLNEFLKNGAGHIGYGIKEDCRNKGYATKGLKLAIEKAFEIIEEDEIYMSVSKNNLQSLKVQLNNGAYIHHEDDEKYYTRIKNQNKK
ncbi:MAG: GNAT family N-acetyltransferase [Peptoniphilaceae bacterium]|nr:GNAT family N-acetyltransferase [Peptoniphilaceae bacterium]